MTTTKSDEILTRLKKYPNFPLQHPIERDDKKRIKRNLAKTHQFLKKIKLKAHQLREEHLQKFSKEAELLENNTHARYLRTLIVIEKTTTNA